MFPDNLKDFCLIYKITLKQQMINVLRCMFCSNRLNWQCDYDTPNIGYQREDIVGCYNCTYR